ncbi:uncharacterized protein LOC115766280 [Drosophila novamexicana]|uniref:uncharacterized protein LOC115766280 n=1 Tax=Drosophila novamexicana TaxID=47314 RepID=UPI0011E5B319|nr:uncharacterized protein LOC115766280 [Drosophila novamexicana]
MLSVMAKPQEVLDVEMPTAATNSSPLQGTVNVITIISYNSSNNNNSSSNSNNNNNNSSNNHNNNDNGSIIPGDSTLPPVEAGGATEGAQVEHSFVAIPLLERRRRSRSHSRCRITPLAPIHCIQNGAHPEDLTQLSRSASCFVRFSRSFVKFFGKIMGSNNPSEADRYDYYDLRLTQAVQHHTSVFSHAILESCESSRRWDCRRIRNDVDAAVNIDVAVYARTLAKFVEPNALRPSTESLALLPACVAAVSLAQSDFSF